MVFKFSLIAVKLMQEETLSICWGGHIMLRPEDNALFLIVMKNMSILITLHSEAKPGIRKFIYYLSIFSMRIYFIQFLREPEAPRSVLSPTWFCFRVKSYQY
jgi:hypothetical protein